MSEKTWREAKPKWAVEAAEKEIADMKRRLALRWPDEARPNPVPFSWGAYDRLFGDPAPGTYFYHSQGLTYPVEIRASIPGEGWKKWRFAVTAGRFTDSVVRGPLYETEREAKLAALWYTCDQAAAELEKAWDTYVTDRGYW